MNKKLFTLLSVLLIAMVAVSPVYAGGVKISFTVGSLKADGDGFGFSGYGLVKLTLDAMGKAHVSCIDPGDNGNVVPGQNPIIPITSTVSNNVTSDKNGKFPIHLVVDVDATLFSPEDVGCPNNNWIVEVDWVDWTWAKFTVEDLNDVTGAATGNILWTKEYTCTSTPTAVSCKAIK
jgi:hypothetical protein